MKNFLSAVFFSVLAINLASAQSTNKEYDWVNNKTYTLAVANAKCADSITFGLVLDDASGYNFVKFIETKSGKRSPSVKFIAPKTSITMKKPYSKEEVEGKYCISLISSGDELVRFVSAAEDGKCVVSSSEVFVSIIKITKNYFGQYALTVEKIDRFVNEVNGEIVGDLNEVVTSCVYN